MLRKEAATQKFRQCRLSKLICVQISGLLDDAQSFNRRRRSDNPTNSKARESDFCKTINVNHDIRTIQLFERRNALLPIVQPRVDMVFDNGNLIACRHFKNFAPCRKRNRSTGRILEIRSEHHQFDAICRERSFERFKVNAKRTAWFRVRLYWNTKTPRACTIKNGDGTWICRIFENDRIARPNECLADQIKRLLAAVGDEEIFVLRGK